PDLVDGDDAGLLVDAHLDHLGRIAVAHGAADGRAAIFLAAVGFWNGRVIAGDGDGAGVFERLGDDLVEGEALVLRAGAIELAQAFDLARLGFELSRGGGDQHGFEILRGVDGGIADHEGDARRIGAVVLRHHFAVAGDDADARQIEPEHFGDRLREDGGRALADIGGAGQDDDRAVEIELDLNRGMRLAGPVHRFRSAADVMGAGHAETFTDATFAFRQFASARMPAAFA